MSDLFSEAATYSAIAAAFSAVAAIASYQVNRKSLSAKLTDRLYDFDKLIMGNAKEFAEFLAKASRPQANYFETTTTPTCDYVKLKAFTYYYLNLFDEIYSAYGTRLFISDDTWDAWQHYIFERIKHPLVKELLLKECHLEIQNGKLVKMECGPSVFTKRYIDFLIDNFNKWKGSCDPKFW